MTMSLLMRWNLSSWPGNELAHPRNVASVGAPGGIMNPDFYLSPRPCTERSWFSLYSRRRRRAFGNDFLPIQNWR